MVRKRDGSTMGLSTFKKKKKIIIIIIIIMLILISESNLTKNE